MTREVSHGRGRAFVALAVPGVRWGMSVGAVVSVAAAVVVAGWPARRLAWTTSFPAAPIEASSAAGPNKKEQLPHE